MDSSHETSMKNNMVTVVCCANVRQTNELERMPVHHATMFIPVTLSTEWKPRAMESENVRKKKCCNNTIIGLNTWSTIWEEGSP